MKTDEQKVEDVVLVLDPARAWLRNYCADKQLTIEELMQAAKRWIEEGDTFDDQRVNFEETPDEFWMHYEAITNQVLDPVQKTDFFKCC